MNAENIERLDRISVRRTNEKKFRNGLVMDIQIQNVFGYESVIAMVAFDKKTELVNLSNAEVRIIWAATNWHKASLKPY